MNLFHLLERRAADGRPLRVALIGAGKFGSMFLAQARRTPGIHIVAIADLAPQRARDSLARTGWEKERFSARSFDEAGKNGATCITEDSTAAIASGAVEIVIDAIGSPAAGIRHALACCQHGKHIVMVNVEADCLVGPLLARRAREAGIVYSLAYGDQPALICEMADWVRAAGFEVVTQAKAPSIFPRITIRSRTPYGATMVSRRSKWRGEITTRRCSTHSWTAPSPRSRWPRSPDVARVAIRHLSPG